MNALADRLSIGEVCSLLDLKPHIVRYWEQEVDFLAPGKDLSGRRSYTVHDLHILARLKYLVQERRFTLEGARDRIFTEITGGHADINIERKALIQEMRQTLFHAAKIHRHLTRCSSESPSQPVSLGRLNAIAAAYLDRSNLLQSEEDPRWAEPLSILRLQSADRSLPRSDRLACGVTVVPVFQNNADAHRLDEILSRIARRFPASRSSDNREPSRASSWLIVVPVGYAEDARNTVHSARPDLNPDILENLQLIPTQRGYKGSPLRAVYPGSIGAFLLLRYGQAGITLSEHRSPYLYNIPFSPDSEVLPKSYLVQAMERWKADCVIEAVPATASSVMPASSGGTQYSLTGRWLCTLQSIRSLRAPLPARLYQATDGADNDNRVYFPGLEVAWLGLRTLIRRSVVVEGEG